jgi:hypothetical protein
MKKIDLGQTLQILGNVGVIVGILLLVYELNQNRQMMQAQTRNELSQTIVNQFFDSAGNESLADIVHRGQSGNLESEVEQRRYEWFLFSRFRYWENVHYQYRLGLYDEDEFSAQIQAFLPTFRRSGVSELWKSIKPAYSQDFVAAVDEMLTREITE